METMTLANAFAKFGGKAASRLHGLSAIAADGSLILACSAAGFVRPKRGVLRYEDRLLRENETAIGTQAQLLGQHLTLARDGELPIRMIVTTEKSTAAGKTSRSTHVRTDLVGKVMEFDGDHFVVDFTRAEEPHVPPARRK